MTGIHEPDLSTPFADLPRQVLDALAGPTATEQLNRQLLGERIPGVDEPLKLTPELRQMLNNGRRTE